ncbi:MAG: hypothetical protein ACI84C_002927 [Flavobacteriales bacterium]
MVIRGIEPGSYVVHFIPNENAPLIYCEALGVEIVIGPGVELSFVLDSIPMVSEGE